MKSALSPLDLTQQSAALLCDLQCRSSKSSNTTSITSWWTTLFLYLMTLQLTTTSKTLLMAIWTLSPSRMAALIQASQRRLTSRSTTSSTTLLLSQSTTALAQRNAATGSVNLRQGALVALQRRYLVEAQRARIRAVAERTHQTAANGTMALKDQRGSRIEKSGGDDDDGVGR